MPTGQGAAIAVDDLSGELRALLAGDGLDGKGFHDLGAYQRVSRGALQDSFYGGHRGEAGHVRGAAEGSAGDDPGALAALGHTL